MDAFGGSIRHKRSIVPHPDEQQMTGEQPARLNYSRLGGLLTPRAEHLYWNTARIPVLVHFDFGIRFSKLEVPIQTSNH
jgi:hypothetical protein